MRDRLETVFCVSTLKDEVGVQKKGSVGVALRSRLDWLKKSLALLDSHIHQLSLQVFSLLAETKSISKSSCILDELAKERKNLSKLRSNCILLD